MVLGTSEVEIAYNTYRDDPTEVNLQAFIRSKPRDHYENIAKKGYLELIQDSQLSWDTRLEKYLSQKPNRVLIQLCQDNLINHLSRNNKVHLVSKLVTHFQEKSGEWELTFSNQKFEIVNTFDKMSIQNGSENERMSIQSDDKKENVNTSSNENVLTNNQNVNTEKETRKKYLQIRVSKSEKEAIEQNANTHGYKSISKFARNVLTNNKNVLTNSKNVNTKNQNSHKDPIEYLNLQNRKLDARVEKLIVQNRELEKDRALLLKFIKIFIQKDIETEEKELTDNDIELIKKHSEEALKDA